MTVEVKGLLKETWRRYCRMVAKTWPVLLLVYVPVEMVYVALVPDDPEEPQVFMSALRWHGILYGVFGILAVAVAYRFVAADRENRKLPCWQLFAEGCSAWRRLFFANLIASCVIFFLLLCLVVPGIVWAGFYAFTAGCAVIGGLGPAKALEESKRLVKGRWWSISLTALGFWALAYVVGIMVWLIFDKACAWLFFLLSGVESAWIVYNAGLVLNEVAVDIVYMFAHVGMAVLYCRRVETKSGEMAVRSKGPPCTRQVESQDGAPRQEVSGR